MSVSRLSYLLSLCNRLSVSACPFVRSNSSRAWHQRSVAELEALQLLSQVLSLSLGELVHVEAPEKDIY